MKSFYNNIFNKNKTKVEKIQVKTKPPEKIDDTIDPYKTILDMITNKPFSEHEKISNKIKDLINKYKINNRKLDLNKSINDSNDTLLHIAVQEWNTEVMETLLENGADVNAKDKYGNTPLERSINKPYLPVVEVLIKYGADTTIKGLRSDITTLQRLEEQMEQLYNNNPADDDLNGQVKLDIIKFLRRHTPLPRVEMDNTNNTPILNYMNTIDEDEEDIDLHASRIIRTMIISGANVNEVGPKNITPFHLAAEKKLYDLLLTLGRNGGNMNSKDLDGNTPLHISVMKMDYYGIKYFTADTGYQVKVIKNNDGKTPLELFILKNEEFLNNLDEEDYENIKSWLTKLEEDNSNKNSFGKKTNKTLGLKELIAIEKYLNKFK